MTQPNDPAFPVSPSDYSAKHGLTKREYFAAMAMQGLLASDTHYTHYTLMTDRAVDFADMLIEKLNSTEDAKR